MNSNKIGEWQFSLLESNVKDHMELSTSYINSNS